MATTVPLYEHAESRSPGSVGFGFEGARGMMDFWADHAQMFESILAVVGDVETLGNGGLKRRLPMAHPEFGWLRADRLANSVGVGVPDPKYSRTAQAQDNAPEQYGDYPERLLTVEFSGKNYTLLPDSAITRSEITWYDANGTGQAQPVYPEWKRYCSWDYQPASELITAQQGQTFLGVDSSPIRNLFGPFAQSRTQGPPHGYQFTGTPRIWWKKTAITVTWWWVPATYITSPNSYLSQYLMCVNLYPIWGYEAGQILYLGSKPKFFTPPLPKQLDAEDSTVFSIEQVCVIEMSFMATRVTTPSGVNMAGAGGPNAVWNGFNLSPTFYDRKFYPTFTPNPQNMNDATRWVPPHDAVPFDVLFTDPNA